MNFIGTMKLELDIAVFRHARTCGDQLTNDDVFLKTKERIDFAFDGGVGQVSRRLLEGSS